MANGKLQGLLRDVKSNRELHRYHHSTLGRASTSPKTICHLWKSCVLVHATQYLRYIHFPTQLNEIQSEVNNSMQSAFEGFGLHSTFQADLGIPPLVYYQMKQLPCSYFWLTSIHTNSITGQFYPFRIYNPRNLHHKDLETRFIQSCRTTFAGWAPADPLPHPKYFKRVMLKNREKTFNRALHDPVSVIWWMKLRPQPLPTGPTRHSADIAVARSRTDRPDLFKPAPYPLAENQISPKCLFRIRTQHSKESQPITTYGLVMTD